MNDKDKARITEILNENGLIDGTLIKGFKLIEWEDKPDGFIDCEDEFSSVGKTLFGNFFIQRIAPHPANPDWSYALSFSGNGEVKTYITIIICAALNQGNKDNTWAREDAKQIAMGWLLAQLQLAGVSL